ncbi:hypothetical protein [Aeromonas veronii]|uniref:hypothetical protein n=1 Tax=Aeromonas veronii TaxID=654 RepID=UPI0024419199|nr:hypothetical protein [Aeromonas veronii]
MNLTIVNGTATSNVQLKLVNDELQFANGTPATGYSYNHHGRDQPDRNRPGEGQSITVTATQLMQQTTRQAQALTLQPWLMKLPRMHRPC